MILRLAKKHEAEDIYALYRSVVGQTYCTWSDLYPGKTEIIHDLETKNLFLLEENGEVVGAVSVVPENEMDEFSCWEEGNNAYEIARVVINPSWQGKGCSRILISEILDELKCRNCSSVHLSVSVGNVPAFKTYKKLGFVPVGEKDMYGNYYYLCEKKL